MFFINQDKGTDYVFSWKSNRVVNSKVKPLYNTFLNSIKISQYRIGIKFDKNPLAVEQNNTMIPNKSHHIVRRASWTLNSTQKWSFLL